ncbi:MAG: MFS transporter, partial [Acidimicrobiales bacterium]
MTTLDDRPAATAPLETSNDVVPQMRPGLRGLYDGLSGWTSLRRTPYGLVPIVIIGLVALVQIFDYNAWQLAGPEFIKHGVSVSTVFIITSQLGFVSVAGGLVLAWYSDRGPRVRIFSIGTILSGIGCMGTALSLRVGAIGTARVIDEAASAGYQAPQDALIADYYAPAARGRAFAVLNVFYAVATLSALIVSALLIKHLGLFRAFAIIGGSISALGVVALLVLREPVRGYFERRDQGLGAEASAHEDEPVSFGEAWRTVFAIETLRRFFVGQMILYVVELPFELVAGLYLADRYGLDVVGRALVFTPAIVTGLAGALYGGTLIDQLGRRNPQRMIALYGLAQVFTVISAVGYAVKPQIAILAVIIAVRHIPDGLTVVGQSAVISQVIPANVRAQGIQMQQSLSRLAGFLFGFAVALRIVSSYGYTWFFVYAIPNYVIGGFVLASAAPYFDSDRRRSQAVARAAEDWRAAKRAGSS